MEKSILPPVHSNSSSNSNNNSNSNSNMARNNKNVNEISEDRRNALNALLAQTGTQSTSFMMVLATNRPQDLDDAVMDRMDDAINFPLPSKEQLQNLGCGSNPSQPNDFYIFC